MKKVKGLSKNKTNNKKNCIDRQQYDDYQRENRVGDVGQGKGGINGDGRRLGLGW